MTATALNPALPVFPVIGYMPMPADFPYAEVLRKGQPVHTPTDDFRLKHPSMPAGRRAKLFSPFDALKGFNEAVASKEVLYEMRRQLSEGEIEELDRRLNILHALTQTHALAKRNCVMATAVWPSWATRLTRPLMRQAPSKRLYSV